MPREPRRIPLTGSTFIRSLAALTDVDAPASPEDFAQRLSRWFDWTHAISLSAALTDVPPPAAAAHVQAGADERELARVRAALVRLIDETTGNAEAPRPPTAARAGRGPLNATPDAADYATYRQRYATCQQAMDSQIGPLRSRVRATLAAGPPALAKLAELDGVMERALGAQERVLLSTVPGRLEARAQQLRGALRSASADAAGASASSDTTPGTGPETAPETPPDPAPGLATFRQEMRALLLAELDLRLQPVAGLLAAAQPSPPDRHE